MLTTNVVIKRINCTEIIYTHKIYTLIIFLIYSLPEIKQEDLNSFPWENWRRPHERPHTMWMKTIHSSRN